MPRGVVAPYTSNCRACRLDFVTDRPGKAGWYCARAECMEQRQLEGKVRSRSGPKPTGLEEDLEIVLRLAEAHGANPRMLRESIQALARGQGNQRFHYRRIAAASLSLAAYLGGHTV